MANVCERCKHSMSIHDNHASCPQCRIAAGECSLDLDKPCGICANWTQRQWGKLRRSLLDARARSTQRGRPHWSTAFPRLEAWILSKPVSTSASEISSQAGEEDFEDNVLASTPKQQVEQVLVVQAQNGVNMASGMSTTAPSTAITAQSTAPSTAPLQVADPVQWSPLFPLANKWVRTRQVSFKVPNRKLEWSRLRNLLKCTPYMMGQQYTADEYTAHQPYISGQQYTAPLPFTAPQPYAAPYAPAMSARPALSMGYYGQGNQFPFAPNPGWLTQEQLLQQQQLIQERQEFEAWRASRAQANLQPRPQMNSAGQPALLELDLNIRPLLKLKLNVQGLHQHLADPPLPRGTTLGGLALPLGSSKRAEHMLPPAQDLEALG